MALIRLIPSEFRDVLRPQGSCYWERNSRNPRYYGYYSSEKKRNRREKIRSWLDVQNAEKALKRAVAEGCEATEAFLDAHAGYHPDASALALACRIGNPKTVHLLLEHKATLAGVEHIVWPFCADDLFGPEDGTSEDDAIEILDLLQQYGSPYPSGMLVEAVLSARFRTAGEMVRRGVTVAGQYRAILNGTCGEVEDRTDRENLQQLNETLRNAMQQADNAKLRRIIWALRLCMDGDRVAVYRDDVTRDPDWEHVLHPRFREATMLEFMLENTTISRCVSESEFLNQILREGQLEALEVLVRHGYVRRDGLPDLFERMLTIMLSRNNVSGIERILGCGYFEGPEYIQVLQKCLRTASNVSAEVRAMAIAQIHARTSEEEKFPKLE